MADEVEEWPDRRVHRPLARPLVRFFVTTPITPNQVTLLSGAAGVFAAVLIFASLSRPVLRLVAGVMLLASAVLDCADGQLARARGVSTPQGGALDGISDELVGFSVILASSFILDRAYGGAAWLAGGAAMFSSSLQCLIFDAAKERYVAQFGLAHGASKLAMADRGSGTAVDSRVWRGWLSWTFDGYVRRIRWLANQLDWTGVPNRETARKRIRSWTTLGLGTHMACGYVAIALSAAWLPALYMCLLLFAVVMNVQLVRLVSRDRRIGAL